MQTSRKANACAIAFAAIFPAVATFAYSVFLIDTASAIRSTVYVMEKIVQIGFPLFWVVMIQRRKLRISRPHRAGLGAGLLFGGVVMALMFVVYWTWFKPAGFFDAVALKKIVDQVRGLGIGSPAKFIAFGLFIVTLHSLLEEYYWRWFVFGELRSFVSLNWAVGISSVAFMSFHVIHLGVFFGWTSPATWKFALAVAFGGTVWAWIYHRSKTLYGPWLSHLLVDVAVYVIAFDLIRNNLE